ncbi:hypothetical protein B0H10DRAFT_1336308 [Mycena sp. CBHHK59/15]|nr:hypothetical protein B0H10DRAFT_1336308 [Mycena sp. CBHHK59/15]
MGTMLWIRISTGQLCIEVNDNEEQDPTSLPWGVLGSSISGVHLTSDTNLEDKVLSNISLDDIHHLFIASARWHRSAMSDPGTILLGSLSWPKAGCEHRFNPFSEISLLDSLGLRDVYMSRWENTYPQWPSPNEGPVILPNGLTRVALADLPISGKCHLRKKIYLRQEAETNMGKLWFSQANHIMDKSGLDAGKFYLIHYLGLQFSISSNFDEFTLQGTFMADSPKDDIYLFLFPNCVDSAGGHLAVYLPPKDETYHWSKDPEGINHLPSDALDKFALPRVTFQALVYGSQWSKAVYNSIADCHRSKGFDPTSQDVAIKLGYPLVDINRLDDLITGGKIEVVNEVEPQKSEI